MLVGVVSVAVGGLFYFVARPLGASYFQRKLAVLDEVMPRFPDMVGPMAGALPEFIHPFAFSLITMGILSRTRTSRLSICVIFLMLNLFFEIGQKYKHAVAGLVPDWFGAIPVLENTRAYFLKGVYSLWDVAAIVLGSVAAFAVAEITIILNNRMVGKGT